MVEKFEQELRLLPTLNHRHIVRFEEIVFEPEVIYLVMEYCSKGDLFTRIATQGPLREGSARDLFRQICEAVEYIHSRDISHRDLKPENILLSSDGEVKLADFGLCHSTSSRRLLITPCGSPLYAPPEIISAREYDGKSADVWSLGICLYVMVTGVLPWTDDNQVELFRQICHLDIDIPEWLSSPLQTLVSQMLAREPTLRPSVRNVLDAEWVTGGRQPGFTKSRSCLVKRVLPSPVPGHEALEPPYKAAARRLVVKPKKADVATPDFADLMRHVPQPGKRTSLGPVTWK
jgi:serine/threonine protein kinase